MLNRNIFELANDIEDSILRFVGEKPLRIYVDKWKIQHIYQDEHFDKGGIYCICPFANAHVFIATVIETNEEFQLFTELQRRSWESKLVRL
jgi:hypothetical protein